MNLAIEPYCFTSQISPDGTQVVLVLIKQAMSQFFSEIIVLQNPESSSHLSHLSYVIEGVDNVILKWSENSDSFFLALGRRVYLWRQTSGLQLFQELDSTITDAKWTSSGTLLVSTSSSIFELSNQISCPVNPLLTATVRPFAVSVDDYFHREGSLVIHTNKMGREANRIDLDLSEYDEIDFVPSENAVYFLVRSSKSLRTLEARIYSYQKRNRKLTLIKNQEMRCWFRKMPYQFRSSSDQTLLLATEGNRQVLYDLTLPNRTKSLEIDRSWRVNFARWGREQNWIYLTQAHHSSQTSTQIKQLNFDLMTISEYSVDPILRESQIVGTTKQQELVLYANQGLHGLTRLPSHPTHPKKAGSIVNWSFNISDKSPKITRVSDEIDSLKPIQERRPTFLYLSGPHRKYTFGLEEGFFQHCVVGYLSALAESEHINVFLHNESVKDSSPLFGYEALGQLVKQVQILTHGAPIVLCSSSLGVLSLLQLLHYSSDIAGAVLINPVYQLKSIGTVKQLSDEVADSFVDSEEVARHIKSKILIFHSASDSVVPYQATSKFLEQIPDSCFKRYITLYDEDHVITNYDSWNTIYHETKRFLKSEIA